VTLAVHGDHQVSNALCAAAVALECGAGLDDVAASLGSAGPVSRHRMAVSTRADGVTIINDAYNANPDSMRAGLKALAWMATSPAVSAAVAGSGPGSDVAAGAAPGSDVAAGAAPGSDVAAGAASSTGARRRSWAVLGEMAELGDDAIAEHDSIGRLAVRLDVSRLVVVGTGRSLSAMQQGAVMEGSWGSEVTAVADADAARALLRTELRDGDVVLVKASNSAGLGNLADALARDAAQ
jgi:UDP-N-acetylmuramoyl-tripeptide--D-alanyl-D-alanine ligase